MNLKKSVLQSIVTQIPLEFFLMHTIYNDTESCHLA